MFCTLSTWLANASRICSQRRVESCSVATSWTRCRLLKCLLNISSCKLRWVFVDTIMKLCRRQRFYFRHRAKSHQKTWQLRFWRRWHVFLLDFPLRFFTMWTDEAFSIADYNGTIGTRGLTTAMYCFGLFASVLFQFQSHQITIAGPNHSLIDRLRLTCDEPRVLCELGYARVSSSACRRLCHALEFLWWFCTERKRFRTGLLLSVASQAVLTLFVRVSDLFSNDSFVANASKLTLGVKQVRRANGRREVIKCGTEVEYCCETGYF